MKKIAIIIVILLVLIAAVGGTLLFLNNSQKKNSFENNNIEENIENVENENLEIISDDFKQDEITAEIEKGKIASEKSIYTDENSNRAVIPAGYGVVKDTSTINKGLVISDIADDDMQNSKGGNQFVWIPVATPFLDLSNCKTEDEINSSLKNETSQGKYPMAIRLANGNYAGVLYKFEQVKENTSISITPEVYGKNAIRKEPSATSGQNENYQNEFNNIAKQVRNDGGFWIARFETSLNEQTNKAESKKNRNVLTNKNWFELYEIEKTLSTQNTTSGMIWGCQWDQIMILFKDVENAQGSQSHFYILDSTNAGNYSDLEIRDGKNVIKKAGEAVRYPTGYIDNFEIFGIYDLAGNAFEWTMEEYYGSTRVLRGGYCAYDGKTYPVASRTGIVPNYSGEERIIANTGSRMILY